MNTVAVYPSSYNQEIIAVVVSTATTPGNITSFTFNTNGTTNPLTTISNARLWYTNSCPVFLSYCASGAPVQFGTAVPAPNGSFSFTGNIALSAGCVYYFWLTYDIQPGAAIGAIVDAQCTGVSYTTVQAPVITSPAGSRTVSTSLPPVNLVPNPSFEGGACPYTTGCSVLFNGLSEVGLAYPWYMPTSGTPDYQKCGLGTPSVYNPAPPARTGSATVGQYFYGLSSYREYIQVPLSRPLIAGNTYEVSYYVRVPSSQAGCQVLNMSAYFSAGPVLNYTSWAPLAVNPQVTASSLTGSASAWSLVCGCFIASGGENYLTIGNFKSDAVTTQVGCGLGYFFVDDVAVHDISQSGLPVTCSTCMTLPVELLSFNAVCKDNNLHLEWSTASEQNNDYFIVERSNDGMNFGFIGMVDGAGNTAQLTEYSLVDEEPFKTSYYRLRQIDFDGHSSYFDVISAHCGPGEITIHFNSGSGEFVVEGAEENSSIMVTDVLGRVVYMAMTKDTAGVIRLAGQRRGLYFIRIESPGNLFVKKAIMLM